MDIKFLFLFYYLLFLHFNIAVCKIEQVNIFVHGTIGAEIDLTPKTFFKLIRDKIHTTEHPKKVSGVREKLVMRGIHCINPLGITRIDCAKCSKSADIFALLFDQVNQNVNKSEDIVNNYYTFGWSGLLSYSERKREAQNLYDNIVRVVKSIYKKTKQIPRIRVIGYSHGGDVTLRLSQAFNRYNLKIDELILIGMPVSYKTKTYLNSPMFKKIYNIYSQGDNTQYLDLFSPCSLISYKRLPYILPHITEVELKIKAKRLNPTCCNLPRMFRGTSNQSPGHIEIWSFGWVKKHYRKNFVFYPLPAAIFIPYLINIAKNYPGQRISIDIRPDQENMILKQKRKCIRMPFLKKEFVQYLKDQAFKTASVCSLIN